MSALVWVSLAVCLVAIAAGAVVAGRRGLATFRAARGLQRSLDAAVAPIVASAGTTEGRVATASEAPVRLEHAARGIQRSIARLSYMRDESRDARLVLRLIRFVRS
jgi:hypothetical protein